MPAAKQWIMRLAALLLLLVLLFMSGPRPEGPLTMTPVDQNQLGPDLDATLAASEARFPDIRPGLAKEIIWADPATKAKTPFAIVYLHGFSASKGEVRPLPDLIAKSFNANLFYTRLTGHGRTSDAMAEATVADWMKDTAEALAIGERLGDRTIIIATSTGGTLALAALADKTVSRNVAALVLLSPNLALKSKASFLLTVPWSNLIVRAVLGKTRSFETVNALHDKLWTASYPTSALLPMAALVRSVSSLDVASFKVPALFIASPKDQVVDPEVTAAVASRWGGPHELIDPEPVEDPSHHVVAGDVLSPSVTPRLAGTITDWLTKVLKTP